MGFPSKLLAQRTTDMDDAQEPFGVTGVLIVIGGYIVSAVLLGTFGGLAYWVGWRAFNAMMIAFPGP